MKNLWQVVCQIANIQISLKFCYVPTYLKCILIKSSLTLALLIKIIFIPLFIHPQGPGGGWSFKRSKNASFIREFSVKQAENDFRNSEQSYVFLITIEKVHKHHFSKNSALEIDHQRYSVNNNYWLVEQGSFLFSFFHIVSN